MFQKIKDFITYPYRKWKEHRAWKKKLEELRKRDPFIYK
jgi:hypothetical protein